MIFEIFSAQVDRCLEIDAVVTEVDETYEFVMGKAGEQAVFCQCDLLVIQDQPCFFVGARGKLLRGEAAKADMFFQIGDGSTVIDAAIFFGCCINTG